MMKNTAALSGIARKRQRHVRRKGGAKRDIGRQLEQQLVRRRRHEVFFGDQLQPVSERL
jgi:hypothetical protein